MEARVILFLCALAVARAGDFITPICMKLDKPLKVTSQGIPRIVVEGTIFSEVHRFNINLVDGDMTSCVIPDSRNFIFHMVPRVALKQFAINTWIHNTSACIKTCGKTWGLEEDTPSTALSIGVPFEMTVACETNFFQIYVNGEHVASYEYRVPLHEATYLVIGGDATLRRVEVFSPDTCGSSPAECCHISQIDTN